MHVGKSNGHVGMVGNLPRSEKHEKDRYWLRLVRTDRG